MATSRLMPRHIDAGRSILATIAKSIDYGKNPDKTRDGKLISYHECDPRTAAMEFTLAKRQYASITGREQPKEKDILLYQIRQAFPKGEITPEEANRVAHELALRWTKGKHAFLVCTHEDKEHIHSHIYYNSTNLDCNGKFNNFLWSAIALRRLSDLICVENGLSIIRNPKPGKGKHYGAWLGDDRPPSFQQRIKNAIDAALEQKPASFDDFLRLMEGAGYKVGGGKRITFLCPADGELPAQKKPTRCDTLKGDYTVAAIRERIEGKRIVSPKAKDAVSPAPPKLNLLIDVQNSIKAKGSPGYERWAKVFNLKQAAQTLIMLQENNLTEYGQLSQRAEQAAARFNELGGRIKGIDARLSEIAGLQKHIGSYGKTRDVYAAYKAAGFSKKFFSQHEQEIQLHREAKKAFDALGLKKILSIKALKQEYAALSAEKKKLYGEYHTARQEMKDFITAKSNVDRLLRYNEQEHIEGGGHEK